MDWVEAVDVQDMLQACELLIRFSLYRKESRGGFYREDYPFTDNIHWLMHLIGRQEGAELQLKTEPFDLPYVRPTPEVVDFFAIDY